MLEQELEQPKRLLIGDNAPAWSANTTFGKMNLSDFLGKWVLLFSHPADFTPVCTTEFIAFTLACDEFKKRNVQLIGLSIDSVHSHIAWMMNIEEKFGVKVPFPVISDLDMGIANLYGMIHDTISTTATIRAVFLIDDKGILRAMLYYPPNIGRNVAEILRIVDAVQLTDKHDVATPEGWKPGDKVIVPPPSTLESAKAQSEKGYECIDWYFCKKEV